jgi:ADP-heptose:LPS heptosyltransferase
MAASLARASESRRIVFSSGPSDRGAAARIAAAARHAAGPDAADRILDIGDFDLAELRALVARSRLFVGGDTGPLHVAATTSTPIVAVYGPTLPARSAPWRNPLHVSEAVEVSDLACRPCDQRVCEPGDYRCLAAITPAQVVEAAERALRCRPS